MPSTTAPKLPGVKHRVTSVPACASASVADSHTPVAEELPCCLIAAKAAAAVTCPVPPSAIGKRFVPRTNLTICQPFDVPLVVVFGQAINTSPAAVTIL